MKRAKFAEYIEERIRELKLTRTAFAKKAGISRSELYKILGQDVGEVRLSTLAGLARALDVNVLNLIHDLVGTSHSNALGSCRPRYPGDALGIVRATMLPDCRAVGVNEEFEQFWGFCNLGTVTWEGRRLVCLDGNVVALHGRNRSYLPLLQPDLVPAEQEIALPVCASGASVRVSVKFRAPGYACTTTSYWKIVDESGTYCFPGLDEVFCKIHVIER